MYRGASEHVDEHDRAAAAVLMAEALLTACDESVAVIATDATQQPERWRAVMQLHDTFPDVWRGLDRARKLLAARGYNTIAYDELMPAARRSALHARVHGIDKTVEVDASHLDRDAVAEAHRAVEQLKLSVPNADWSAIEARTRGLASAQVQQHRRPRLVVAGVAGAVGLAVAIIAVLPNPVHRPKVPHAVTLKAELDRVKAERQTQIAGLRPQVVAACDPPKARTYTQLLVMDGRGADATSFAADYADRCGEDPVVQNWANAPLPGVMKDGVYQIDFPALDVSAAGTADLQNALR